MNILCDKNMPYAEEAFRHLGNVTLKSGRQITAEDVSKTDLLFTRSTTRVNAALLDNSPVRFYGSAVIGTDHIDIPYLNARGIAWTPAPGCNAESVANYVTAALFRLSGQHAFTLAGKTAGVIGVGNVGRRVCRHLRSLGMKVLACDPPRQRAATISLPAAALEDDPVRFVSLDTLLAEADVLTLHVPLTRDGTDPTWHMLDAGAFARMKKGVILINAARGPILDTNVLLTALEAGQVSHAVIDCWEGEPDFRPDLAEAAELSTPHIAGHSYEGKVNGTAITYRAACAFLGVEASYSFSLPPPPLPVWSADARGVDSDAQEEALIRPLILSVYDIEADSRRLKALTGLDSVSRAVGFDKLRSGYPVRRQFDATVVDLSAASSRLLAKLRGLGFRLPGATPSFP